MHSVELSTLGELNIRHNGVTIEFLTADARLLFTYLTLTPDSELAPDALASLLYPFPEPDVARLSAAQENLWEAFPLAVRLFSGLTIDDAVKLNAPVRLAAPSPVISLTADVLDLIGALESDWTGLERPEIAALLTEAAVAIGKGMAPGCSALWLDDWRERLCTLYRDATVRYMAADPLLCLQMRQERLFAGARAKAAPPEKSAFYGRTAELAELRERLASGERVLTLVGLGGVGKTRLALELLSSLPGEMQHWPRAHVSLSGISTRGGLLEALRRGLGQQMGDVLQDGRDPLGAICRALQEDTVLFLDNAEDSVRHCLDGEVVQTLSYLVYRCPQAVVLSTSRCRIGLPEEYVFPVEGLPLPSADETDELTLQELEARYPGLEMLSGSLVATGKSDLSAYNKDSVLALLRQSGGLPLSIELLATRISKQGATLPSLADIRSSAGSPKGAIDWALEPLSGATRSFARRLSIFEGDFSIEDAEAVTGEQEAEFRLTELDDAGLVTAQHSEQSIYRLPTAVRDFLREGLESLPEYTHLLESHTSYFANLASEAHIGIRGVDRVIWVKRLKQAVPDVLSVIQRNLQNDSQVEFATHVFATFVHYFNLASRPHEGISLAKKIIGRIKDIGGVSERLNIEVVDALGRLQTLVGLYSDAEINLKSVYSYWQKDEDKRALARCANNIAVCCDQQGRFDDAKPYFGVAWKGFYELNERRACAQILQNFTFGLKVHGYWEEACHLLAQACEIVTTEFPTEPLTAKFLFDYAEALYLVGDLNKSREVIKKSLTFLDVDENGFRVMKFLILLGLVLSKADDRHAETSNVYFVCGWSMAIGITNKLDFTPAVEQEVKNYLSKLSLKEVPVFSLADLEFFRKQVLTL